MRLPMQLRHLEEPNGASGILPNKRSGLRTLPADTRKPGALSTTSMIARCSTFSTESAS
jgi:hypothetical protein